MLIENSTVLVGMARTSLRSLLIQVRFQFLLSYHINSFLVCAAANQGVPDYRSTAKLTITDNVE